MKKRIYKITQKRKRIIDEALSNAKDARENIDPELLKSVRDAIGGAAETYQSDKYRAMHQDRVPVDVKKNLTIVMKYLELKPDNQALHQEIRSYLTQH